MKIKSKENLFAGLIAGVFFIVIFGLVIWGLKGIDNSAAPAMDSAANKEDIKLESAGSATGNIRPANSDTDYTATDNAQGGIDIELQAKSRFKMTLPASLRDPITISLSNGRTIEIVQKNGSDFYALPKDKKMETPENSKLFAVIQKDPTLSTYRSADSEKTIFYSYQKLQGEQKQWLFKNWILYNSKANAAETSSYEIKNALVLINSDGNAGIYFDDKTPIGNKTPDFVIPKPYILDKDANKTELTWRFNESSRILSVSFTVPASSYPIALDPSILKTDTVIATFSGKVISMKAAFTCGVSTVQGAGGITYGTVVGADGKCWLDRNLGATRVATALDDYSAGGGYLYQWGRSTDGHQITNSGTQTGLSSSDNPGHANFIYGMGSPYDWRSPQKDTLWQGINGINNPCPTGWRLPTQAEWATLAGYFSPQTNAGAYNSALKLPSAGYRRYSDATLDSQGSYGYYWSSSPSGTYASSLYFYSGGVNPAYNYGRALGFSVRCVKD